MCERADQQGTMQCLDMERFFKTVEEGDEGEVAKWLDANPRLLEETNDEGNRPLAMAASRGHLGVVTLLFQRGANVDAANLTGKTALHRAASKGQEGVVTFLLRQGAQANSRNDVGKTPLILASVKGSVGVVRVLLQHVGGEALQETDDKGRTALHWVAYRGHEAVATLLLDQGAKATSRGASGETPFMLACQEGHLAVVGLFLRHVGANIGGQALHHTDDKGTTPLHLAALRGHAELVAFLLGQGAQANSRDILGKTPLLYGCKSGHLGAVRVLALHMGEDGLKEKYAQGRTVLHYAARAGHEDVAALLVGLGAQANSRDAISKTPLMWACEKGHLGVVRMLAQHMGEEGLNEQDANGRTVLHWAVEKGRDEAVKILLLAGADPTITDTEGRTPRALAEGEVERAGCLAAFEWYECEVERCAIVYRATCLHKAYTTQRDMSTSQVPTYLKARVAAGHAVPSVEVVTPQSEEKEEAEEQAGQSGKRQVADEGSNPGEIEVGEEGRHAVLKYVVQALNEALVIELLEGFPL